MMELKLELSSEADTARLGEDIAVVLRQGDLICLQGDLGTGKTALARAMIRALCGDAGLEVPSPTYTLVQTYETKPEVSHFDLYRITKPEEVSELGFEDAVENGVAIVEWPERAPFIFGDEALRIRLEMADSGMKRSAVIEALGGRGAELAQRLRRSLAIREFINETWGPEAHRAKLVGDASARRYETVRLGQETRILMDAPKQPDGPPIRDGMPYSRIAHLAEDVVPFIAISETLNSAGLSAPLIHARRVRDGMLLIEHLGEDRIVDNDGKPIEERYIEAARLLAHMHGRTWPSEISIVDETGKPFSHTISSYDRQALTIEASLFVEWYAPEYGPEPLARNQVAQFDSIWDELVDLLDDCERTLVLRDYHSPNILWRGGETFPRRIGLIDFQDAMIGPTAYDLASLAQDARVDIAPSLEARIVEAYIDARAASPGFNPERFRRDYAILGAQRATKILGIFVRLSRRDGKPAYLRHLPRIRAYLKRNLGHEALAPYRHWCETFAGINAIPTESELQ